MNFVCLSTKYYDMETGLVNFGFQNRFEQAGLNIEDYTTQLPRGLHRHSPDGIHPNGYNQSWKTFFDENDEPTAQPWEV